MGLKTLVSDELQAGFGRIIPQAYRMADLALKSHDFLSWLVGIEALPYMRRPAIDFLATKLPLVVPGLEQKISKNRIGNHSFVELKFKNLRITISHQATVKGELQQIPRPALFRSELAKFNGEQMNLWEETPEPFFGDTPVSAVLFHSGNLQPESAELIVCHPSGRGILDRLPIVLNLNFAEDVEAINDYMPELKNFMAEEIGNNG
jgi:hypothetical protein